MSVRRLIMAFSVQNNGWHINNMQIQNNSHVVTSMVHRSDVFGGGDCDTAKGSTEKTRSKVLFSRVGKSTCCVRAFSFTVFKNCKSGRRKETSWEDVVCPLNARQVKVAKYNNIITVVDTMRYYATRIFMVLIGTVRWAVYAQDTWV